MFRISFEISFEIAAAVLAALGLLYSLTVNRRQYILPKGLIARLQSQHYVFLLLLLSTLMSAVASTGGAYLQSVSTPATAPWQYWLHMLYFISHAMLAAGFALYIMNVNGTSVGRRPVFWVLFLLPFVISELLVLTNPATSLVFYMDEARQYHRSPLMLVLYAIAVLYIALACVSFFRSKKAISRVDSATIGASIILAVAGIAVQAVYPQLKVELFCEALAFHVLLILLEDRSGRIDPVTGALNRLAFSDTNRRLMQTGKGYGIVLVKLTDLELYSTLFNGREMDELLMRVAGWLSGEADEQDVYTYREAHFAVVSHDPTWAEAERLADAILARFGRDWRSGELTLRLSAAVCVLRVPEDVSELGELEELLSCGFRPEGAGSRRVRFDELEAVRRDRTLEAALRRAIEGGKLQVWYQPIWSAETQRTVAAEALLRVDDPALRGVSPELYIPIAERTGMIRQIGLAVFEQVCRFLSRHERELRSLSYVEINLSLYQFLYDDLPARLETIRQRYGVDPHRINLEVTETASTEEAAVMTQAIERLRALGYELSLDDFGAGYSNIYRVVNGGYTNIKLDKDLLWDADKNERSALFLENLIRIIRSLGYHVVQEGVETPAQLERVTEVGCDLIQGYLFSRPVPDDAFLRYLSDECSGVPGAVTE